MYPNQTLVLFRVRNSQWVEGFRNSFGRFRPVPELLTNQESHGGQGGVAAAAVDVTCRFLPPVPARTEPACWAPDSWFRREPIHLPFLNGVSFTHDSSSSVLPLLFPPTRSRTEGGIPKSSDPGCFASRPGGSKKVLTHPGCFASGPNQRGGHVTLHAAPRCSALLPS